MSRLSSFSAHRPVLLRERIAGLAGFVLIVSLAATPLRAQEDTAGAISREVKSLFEHCGRAVVKIHATDEHSELSGTGFFIDPTGTIYTSYSVGGEANNFTVQFGGKKYRANQLMADLRSGIALLKVEAATTPFLPIGKSAELGLATPVVAIGYPLDLPESPSFGMIAGFDRKYLGRYFSTTHLRVNLPTQRGEAGAPLLNFRGQVVGILVSSVEGGSACYAEMTQIRDDAPAAGSGLKAGDILLQVGNTPVHQPEDVIDASFFITAGDPVPITVMRGQQKLTFTVEAGSTKPEAMALGPSRKSVVPLRLDSPTSQTP
jgi:S1-C subfamily serine protease